MSRWLTSEETRRYFELRLGSQRITSKTEQVVKCVLPGHQDKNPSLSVNFESGLWKCWSKCGRGGGLIDFEVLYSDCTRDAAIRNVSQLIGRTVKMGESGQWTLVKTYEYRDIQNRLVFEKQRFRKPDGTKTFRVRWQEGRTWQYKLPENHPRPLYNHPDVIAAHQVVICEGEKDCDNVLLALDSLDPKELGETRVAATTNYDGAGHWRDEYSRYFAGKLVIIFADTDEKGSVHAQQVAESVYKAGAASIKLIVLPGLPPKGDVSDWLEKHTAAELMEHVHKASQWNPAKSEHEPVFVPAVQFFNSTQVENIAWVVEGIIPAGANGFCAGDPKTGKSWVALDLAISASLGDRWLGLRIPRPFRTAFMSREDAPLLTCWRGRHLLQSKKGDISLLESNLYFNSRLQMKNFDICDPGHFRMVAEDLKERHIELLFIDVFNRIHTLNENDNQEMRVVLQQLTNLADEVGCSIGVVHHFKKEDLGGRFTKRFRGAGAIHGWCEWAIGVELVDDESKIRRVEFESKSAEDPQPVYYRINTRDGVASLDVVAGQPLLQQKKSAAQYMERAQ